MAVSWSWAWGAETTTELDEMEFVRPTSGSTQAPTSAAAEVYSYPTSPTRYSWETASVRTIRFPQKAFIDAGTVALPIRADTTWYASSIGPLIQVYSGTSATSINVYITNAGAGTVSLYVDNVLAGTTSLTASNWHYLALQYDMSGTTWTATLYVDGTSAITGSDTGLAAATSGYYESGGFSGNTCTIGQLIVYDTGTVIADAKTPVYCTRLSPANDISETGSWSPASNTGTDAVCAVTANNPFNPATNTTLSLASSGDDQITQLTGINSAIGVLSTDMRGVTAHGYASGTNVNSYVAVDGGGGMVNGTQVTPDTSDTTYAFSSSAVTVANTGNIDFKYEIA